MEYELTIGNSVHIQKMCLKCGRVTDFTDQAISRFIKEKRFSNFNLNHFSLVLYGECKTCRGKTGEERKKEENNTQKQ
jgi:Fe2+ or Zn2+ uptake regulation protein